jgi:hypothetical protein
MVKFIRRCVHMAVIMEPSMWHSIVIQWKAAHGPQVKECVCPKRENNGRNKINWNFERGSEVMKPVYHRQDVKRQI